VLGFICLRESYLSKQNWIEKVKITNNFIEVKTNNEFLKLNYNNFGMCVRHPEDYIIIYFYHNEVFHYFLNILKNLVFKKKDLYL